jgi:phage terminase large subunit-like protein
MTLHWSTACPDWERRIVARESLLPFAPLFPSEAEAALEVFKSLQVVDLPQVVDPATGDIRHPTFGEVSEEWVFDLVRAIFGAYDATSAKRLIREFFLLIAKKNGKSTIAAGIMLTALIRNWRHSAELLILAPTLEVANNSFHPARDMVRADPRLKAFLHVQENFRQITHLTTKAVLKVIAADTDTVGGKKASFVLIDELWIFGKRPNADAMLREATGGLVSRPEGFVIFLSTQSDKPPAGVFLAKLQYFRDVRDGKVIDPKSFGMLFEFPRAMVENKDYRSPEYWFIPNPNLHKSVALDWLVDKYREAERTGESALISHVAKHLNVEIGLALGSASWAGAEFWLANPKTGKSNVDESLRDLDELLRRSEVVVVGLDGGGLDDLLGIAVLGREKDTARWLLWNHAWAHDIVKDRRKEIATALEEIEKAGELTFVAKPGDDVEAAAEIVERIEASGLLAQENSVGCDSFGVVDINKALTREGGAIKPEDADKRIVGVSQGWKLTGAIKTAERNLAGNTLIHGGTKLMNFAVGNAKVEAKGNAIVITKQQAGTAKIDPLAATFNTIVLMGMNPTAAPKYQAFALG